jgi:hypothetical protein
MCPGNTHYSGNKIMGGTSGYSSSLVNDQLLIFLDNSSDGLRKTNYQQWPWLMNTLRGNVPE